MMTHGFVASRDRNGVPDTATPLDSPIATRLHRSAWSTGIARVVGFLLLTAGPIGVQAQTFREWPVQNVETDAIPLVRLSDPRLRELTVGESVHPALELSMTAQNLSGVRASDMWVWSLELSPTVGFSPRRRVQVLPREAQPLGPGEARRLRFVYFREGLDPPPDGTRLLIALKSVMLGSDVWEQDERAVVAHATAVAAGQKAASRDDITYDDFMGHPALMRKQIFVYLPTTRKADLMRTHLRRYLTAHAAELTHDQRSIVEEALSGTSERTYELPKVPSEAERVSDLAKRARVLFTASELSQVFTLDAGRIP